MSYCVNCGVELAPSEPRCPLCDAPVVNPAAPWEEPRVRPYPAYLETVMRRVDKRYFSGLAAVLLLIPVAVCLLVDGLTGPPGLMWSGYVAGAVAVTMAFVLVPIAWGRREMALYLALDAAVLLAFLGFIQWRVGGPNWLWPLGAPIVMTTLALVGLQLRAFYRRRARGILVALAQLVASGGLLTLLVEVYIRLYRGQGPVPRWSWYALVPCLLTALAFLILNRRNRWKESVKKRLFF